MNPDPLRPVEIHAHEWVRCQTCDNGDLRCDEWRCPEHKELLPLLLPPLVPDRPSASDILFVIALAVIVGILVAWAVR